MSALSEELLTGGEAVGGVFAWNGWRALVSVLSLVASGLLVGPGCETSGQPADSSNTGSYADSDVTLHPVGIGCVPPPGTVTGASFWKVDHKPPSAWTNLSPWAFWSVEAARPKMFVELGTHNGYSFFAFCLAVKRLGLGTRAFAVDTWLGDEHAGMYDESVYASVSEYNLENFGSFSTLLRMTFDEALSSVEDGSVDLLHIDGRHFYSDVKHDFESWLPKLTNGALVLMHDVNVYERGFGVYAYWDELAARYPHFTFRQGPGLGILWVGERIPLSVRALVESNEADRQCIHATYEELGSRALSWEPPPG